MMLKKFRAIHGLLAVCLTVSATGCPAPAPNTVEPQTPSQADPTAPDLPANDPSPITRVADLLVAVKDESSGVKPAFKPGEAPGDDSKWLLRVTGLRGSEDFSLKQANGRLPFEKFGIRYRHFFDALGQREIEYSYVGQSAEDAVERPPTLEVAEGTGLADFGLDTDLEYEGIDDPALQYFGIDADSSGLVKDRLAGAKDATQSDRSLNLQYFTEDNTVIIMSGHGREIGGFNLHTGKIVGDASITQDYDSLVTYFKEHNDEPFEAEVNDGGQCAIVGIFSDYRTVAVRECPTPGAPPTDTPPDMPIPEPSPTPPGEEDEGPEITKVPPPGPLERPEVARDEGDRQPASAKDQKAEALGFSRNPGEGYRDFNVIQAELKEAKLTVRRLKRTTEKFKTFIPKARKSLTEGFDKIEDYALQHGVQIPSKEAAKAALAEKLGFNPEDPCEGLPEDGDSAALEARLEAMRQAYGDLVSDYLNNGSEGINLLRHTDGLKDSEAALAFLKFFTDVNIFVAETGVDIIAAGGVRQLLKAALGDKLKELLGVDSPENIAKGEIKAALNTEEKVSNFIDDVVNELPLPDNEKKLLKDSLTEQFSENPEAIADPTAWIKVAINVFFGLGGSVATEGLEQIQNLRQKGREAMAKMLLARLQMLCLLDALQIVCEKLEEKAETAAQAVTTLEQELADSKTKHIEDANKLADLAKIIMDDYDLASQVLAGNPSPEEMKRRLIELIKECLKKLGFNLDCVEIGFNLIITSLETNADGSIRSYTYKIDGFFMRQINKAEKEEAPVTAGALPPPMNIEVVNRETTSIIVEWDFPLGLTEPHHYRVFQDDQQISDQVNSPYFNFVGLSPDTEYNFEVQTVQGNRISDKVSITGKTTLKGREGQGNFSGGGSSGGGNNTSDESPDSGNIFYSQTLDAGNFFNVSAGGPPFDEGEAAMDMIQVVGDAISDTQVAFFFDFGDALDQFETPTNLQEYQLIVERPGLDAGSDFPFANATDIFAYGRNGDTFQCLAAAHNGTDFQPAPSSVCQPMTDAGQVGFLIDRDYLLAQGQFGIKLLSRYQDGEGDIIVQMITIQGKNSLDGDFIRFMEDNGNIVPFTPLR